ncbi:MAG: hypothetical protein HBSAPP02_12380 [Phycisphaerae bacterium]|nr:MAG: hypothetical protein HRU71_08630 [Planctomycetia bacterium]RIK70532.1 MAG: hypothetical protein DCC66_04420 [Planctomycetota bacterium]GJQ26206.1 MAG: hypothetical protein HBSAPP02_12380 [Phycisphaerae bacterium]
MAINRSRLVLGGLAAGLFVNVSGICLAHFVLGPEYFERFKSRIPMTPASMFEHLGLRFLIGFLAVFIYVGFRTRFGAGPRTAVLAGTVTWLLSGLVMTMTLSNLDVLTGWRLWVAAPWSLVEVCIATVLGAWIYREHRPGV